MTKRHILSDRLCELLNGSDVSVLGTIRDPYASMRSDFVTFGIPPEDLILRVQRSLDWLMRLSPGASVLQFETIVRLRASNLVALSSSLGLEGSVLLASRIIWRNRRSHMRRLSKRVPLGIFDKLTLLHHKHVAATASIPPEVEDRIKSLLRDSDCWPIYRDLKSRFLVI